MEAVKSSFLESKACVELFRRVSLDHPQGGFLMMDSYIFYTRREEGSTISLSFFFRCYCQFVNLMAVQKDAALYDALFFQNKDRGSILQIFFSSSLLFGASCRGRPTCFRIFWNAR